jgi:heme-degrading monooxygenase HmoA
LNPARGRAFLLVVSWASLEAIQVWGKKPAPRDRQGEAQVRVVHEVRHVD